MKVVSDLVSSDGAKYPPSSCVCVCEWGHDKPFLGAPHRRVWEAVTQPLNIINLCSFHAFIPALTYSNIYWVRIMGQAECAWERKLSKTESFLF